MQACASEDFGSASEESTAATTVVDWKDRATQPAESRQAPEPFL